MMMLSTTSSLRSRVPLNNNNVIATPRCVPGMLYINRTSCMPCPPGWMCVDGMPRRCDGPAAWSPAGASECLPCLPCPNNTLPLLACGGPQDRECHACPKGFRIRNATLVNGAMVCVPECTGLPDTHTLGLMLLVVLELLACGACFYWYRIDTDYHAPPATKQNERTRRVRISRAYVSDITRPHSEPSPHKKASSWRLFGPPHPDPPFADGVDEEEGVPLAATESAEAL